MNQALRVYIAAPYSRKDEMNFVKSRLLEIGIGVTSSWLKEPHSPTAQMGDLSHEEHQTYALQDIADVRAADAMLFFTDPTKTIIRAGRHVEFGMAVALNEFRFGNYPIFVVGQDRENIFHHLDNVSHYDSWKDARNALVEYSANRPE